MPNFCLAIDEVTRQKIKREVFELIDSKEPDKKAAVDYGAIVISGKKG